MRFLSIPLTGLSMIYGAVTVLRNRLYDTNSLEIYRSTLPVISVGNITAGGNGKTPLCIMLARNLAARGYSPVILMRGYGGNTVGPYLCTGNESAADIGDEALMLSRLCGLKVVVSRKRAAGARLIEQQGIGSLIILDDGFQHRKLARDLDIVTVDVGSKESVDEFAAGRLLPAGLFRESRERAFRRIDMVVLAQRKPYMDGRTELSAVLKLIPRNVRIFESSLRPDGVTGIEDQSRLTAREIAVFSSIAAPQGFHQTLSEMGYEVAASKTFPDHYLITARDLDELRASFPGKPLVCTEKDAVKLAGMNCHGIYVLKVALQVTPADAFMVQVERALNARINRGQG